MKTAAIGIGLVALIGIGTGGYLWSEQAACAELEEDYLNSASAMLDSSSLASLGLDMEQSQDTLVQDAADTLVALRARCGQRAVETANRKAQNVILGR